MKRWWCMDCRSKVGLNKHGRCGSCESEAVVFEYSGNDFAAQLSINETSGVNEADLTEVESYA